MLKHSIARSARVRRAAHLLAAAALLAVLPRAADAQLHALKRLKHSITGDSASAAAAMGKDSASLAREATAKRDSVLRASKLADAKSGDAKSGDAADTSTHHRGRFSRAISAAHAASQKLEEKTGISATDVALAATGVGATGLVAKKLGVDPSSLASKALGNAATQHSQTSAATAAMRRMPTGSGAPDVAALSRSSGTGQRAPSAMYAPGMPPVSGATPPGYSDADVKLLQEYQQEMMRTVNAASAGDPVAQAKMQRMQTIAMKYQPEMQRLSVAAAGGDMTAARRLSTIQLDMIREWVGESGTAVSKASATKPSKTGRP